MSTVRKLRSGKWQVIIRRKDQPVIYKTFKEKGLASKYGKDVEARMERNIFEDYSGAAATTLKDLICKYRDEIVPDQKAEVEASGAARETRTPMGNPTWPSPKPVYQFQHGRIVRQ